MSWLSQALKGDFSWVGGHNTLEQALGLGGIALGGLGLAGAAGIGPAAGLFGAGEAGAAGAGAAAGAAGAPLDLLSFGSAAGTAIPEAAGAIVPATGALASGLATEPAFAGALGGAFAPGLETGLGFASAAPQAGGNALNFVAAGGTPSGGPANIETALGTSTGGVAAPVAPGVGPVAAPGAAGAPTDLTAAAAAGKTAPSGISSVLSSLGIKNPLGAAVAAGGLGYSVLQGQQPSPYAAELEAQAKSLNSQGQQLLSYLSSGNLPSGLKASLTQATNAAKSKIISNYAAQGLPTDPTKNSALAATLAAVDQQALFSTAQIGQQLLQSGISETGLSSDLYKTLAQIDQTQTASIGRAIANFAAAMAGGGGGINLKLAS